MAKIAKIQLPDGRVAKFEVPDDATEQDVLAAVQNLPKQTQPTEQPPNPTDGMSGGEKFLAGMGKGYVDLARGAEQSLPLVSRVPGFLGNAAQIGGMLKEAVTGRTPEVVQAEIDQAKKEDAPLMKTGAGLAGNIAANVTAGLPLMALPGAQTLPVAGVSGGILGFLQPVAEGESRATNTVVGAAGGVGGQLAGRAIPGAAKAVVDPFRKKGQEQIAGRVLKEFAGQNADDVIKNVQGATQLVKGSQPTTAEVAKSGGIAQLQRSLANQSPEFADQLAQRTLDQNSARLAALRELTKYGGNLDEAMTRRAEAGAKLYAKAFGQNVKVDDNIKALTSRPSFKTALERAQRIASEEGRPLNNLFDQNGKFASVRGLHYIKMGFDDIINDAQQSGIGKAELNAIKNTRGELLDWIAEKNPAYNSARIRFEKMSRPINREQVAREITNRATRNQLPNVRGESTLYPDAFARTMKEDGASVVKSVTGREGRTLGDVMTPEQMQTLGNIRTDLSRQVVARDLGRATGSNTSQNLASQNLMRQILGPLGLPQSWSENAIAQTVMRPVQWAGRVGEEGIQAKLAEAMLDPQVAAQLMQNQNISPATRRMLELLTQGSIGTGAAIPLSQ